MFIPLLWASLSAMCRGQRAANLGAFIDYEIEIIQALLDKVCVYDKEIAAVCDACAELDCLLSLTLASREYDYRRPNMVEDNIINIIGGRSVFHFLVLLCVIDGNLFSHPLQEQVVDIFVPNDIHLAGGRGSGIDTEAINSDDEETAEDTPTRKLIDTARSVLICTGANACGKVELNSYLYRVAHQNYLERLSETGAFIRAFARCCKISTRFRWRSFKLWLR